MNAYEAEKQEALYQESLSPAEWTRAAVDQYASVYGEEDTKAAWILSPFDTWEANPHYQGAPQPHPEADQDDWEEENCVAPSDEEVALEAARWDEAAKAAPAADEHDDIPWL